jgi:hypothetical protein
MITYDIDIDNPINFNYDSDVVEITASGGSVKDLTPEGSVFFANFEINENANWCDGSKSGTLNNGAYVDSGELKISEGIQRHCTYNPDSISNVKEKGFVEIKIYSETSTPTNNFHLFDLGNNIYSRIDSSGNLRFVLKDDSGAIIEQSILAVSWPTGDYIVLGFGWDFSLDSDKIFVFIDGILEHSVDASGTKNDSPVLLSVGNNLATEAQAEIDSIIIYDENKHTENYSVNIGSISGTRFTTDPVQIRIKEVTFPVRGDQLLSIDSEALESLPDNYLKYILLKNDIKFYWDGSDWAISDGTINQSNTISEIDLNKETFLTEGFGKNIEFIGFLKSDGDFKTTWQSFTVGVDFSSDEILLNLNIVYGNVLTIGSEIPECGIIEVRPVYTIGNQLITTDQKIEVELRENGNFEAKLYIEDNEPEFLVWYFPNGKIYKTNFVSGTIKFSELEIIKQSDDPLTL